MTATAKDIDDATAAYVLAARKYFEDLKQAEAQLAGLLVLRAAGSREAACGNPLLGSARQACENAAEGLKSLRPTRRARVHHARLLASLRGLDAALRSFEGKSFEGAGDPLIPLQAAHAELQAAAKALPGFEMVSFEQCCCRQAAGTV